MNRIALKVTGLLAAAVIPALLSAAPAPDPPLTWPRQLEADWLLQAQLDADGQRASRVTPRDDAAGGCDGVTNGKWGFHTAEEDNPWWQVDLGEVLPLQQVRLWNRADTESVARRAAHFELLLSADGKSWQRAYQHPGTVFYGYHMPDRSPRSRSSSSATR